MTVGLPGTGIGGIFYLLLAVWMPIRESAHMLKGRTSLLRWRFIVLQLLFVLGVVVAMWGELWLLNQMLACTWGTLKINGPLLMVEQTFRQTKIMAMASAFASFISLAFVITGMHIARFFIHRKQNRLFLAAAKSHPAFRILRQLAPTNNAS